MPMSDSGASRRGGWCIAVTPSDISHKKRKCLVQARHFHGFLLCAEELVSLSQHLRVEGTTEDTRTTSAFHFFASESFLNLWELHGTVRMNAHGGSVRGWESCCPPLLYRLSRLLHSFTLKCQTAFQMVWCRDYSLFKYQTEKTIDRFTIVQKQWWRSSNTVIDSNCILHKLHPDWARVWRCSFKVYPKSSPLKKTSGQALMWCSA